MSREYAFEISPINFANLRSTSKLGLPFPPFSSGLWTLYLITPLYGHFLSEQCSFGIEWTGYDLNQPDYPTVLTVLTPPQSYKVTQSRNTTLLLNKQSIKTSWGRFEVPCVFDPRFSPGSLSLSVILDDDPPPAPAPVSMSIPKAINPFSASRHPNDVRLYFPREGKELWANSSMLKQASPYFKTLLTSDTGFADSQLTNKIVYEEPQPTEMTYDDSDDDIDAGESKKHSSQTKSKKSKKSSQVEEACDATFHVVRVLEATHSTYASLLLWIASDYIRFAELKSSFATNKSPRAARKARLAIVSTTSTDLPLPSSPKSIYRLAHFLEMKELSDLALENVNSQLQPQNVAVELFCDMATQYEAFRSILVDFAVEHWNEVQKSACWKNEEEMVANGETMHAGTMLLELAKRRK